jgi:hypothetical protein
MDRAFYLAPHHGTGDRAGFWHSQVQNGYRDFLSRHDRTDPGPRTAF